MCASICTTTIASGMSLTGHYTCKTNCPAAGGTIAASVKESFDLSNLFLGPRGHAKSPFGKPLSILGVTTPPETPTTVASAAGRAIACPNIDGSSPKVTKFAAYPPSCIDPSKTYTATLQTDAGTILMTLDQKAAPKAVNNFVFLAEYHFYDGTTFHRVVPGFVDQGGDPTATGTGGPGYSFADEPPKRLSDYKAGGVAMANSGPNTNGSQFFILVSDAAGQNLGKTSYTLFANVTSGMDVVQKINADGSTDASGAGKPTVVHTVLSITIGGA